MTGPVVLDGVGLAAAIRTRERSATEVVEEALDRIAALDPTLGACTVTFPEAARAQAQEADRRVVAGGRLPPMLGVPVSVKDHIWLAGELATNGSLAYREFRPAEDCVAVRRLRAAGAIIVAKTNNPEFCYRGFTDNPVFGLTRNPWRLDRTPGGSSGGAGACVAAGMTPIALGTDGGGSIRIPASFCGVVGHKPTFGLVPKEPGFKGWKTLSVDGPLTRSVRDAALALAVLAGPAPEDDMSYPGPSVDELASAADERPLRHLRVAVSVDLGYAPVEPDVRGVFAAAVDRFAALGCRIEEAHPATASPTPLWNRLALVEGYASEGPLLADWADAMSPGIPEIIRAGADIPGWQYVDALHERAAFTRTWAEFFTRYDLLLTPTMQLTAFPVGVDGPVEIDGRPVDPFFDDWCVLAYPANLTGQPAISVPAGHGSDGLPIGLQITGRRFEDATVLAAAAGFERVAPWLDRWPPPFRATPAART